MSKYRSAAVGNIQLEAIDVDIACFTARE
eukprot:Gb_06857 [translate_table: standard]